MEIGKIQQLTTTNPWWLYDPDPITVNCADICGDYFDIYDYEDYLGIAHQLIAEELGYETI